MEQKYTQSAFMATLLVNDFAQKLTHNKCMDTRIESGRRLREARLREGFETLDQLADAAGLDFKGRPFTVSKISNWERGYRAIHPEIAKQLSKILNCSAGWLLCLDDTDGTLMPTERALLENYRATDDRGKRLISRVAEQESPYIGDQNQKAG